MKLKQQISIDEARKFLTLLAPDEKFTFQTFDDNQERKDPSITSVRHGTLDQNFDHLVQYSEKGAGGLCQASLNMINARLVTFISAD